MRVESNVTPPPERIRDQAVRPPEREGGYTGAERGGKRAGESPVERGLESLLKRAPLERHRDDEDVQNLSARLRESADEEERLLNRLREALREMNAEARGTHLTLRFQLHEESERWMVQVVDILDDEVIREIPPERVLDLSARIRGMVGFILDQRR